MTNDHVDARLARCRFCGRRPAPGEFRAPGPHGPICPDCLEAGLLLVRDRQPRRSLGGSALRFSSDPAGQACEFCGRRERRTFLGLHRPLRRMNTSEGDAVICADCLDRGGELINQAVRQRSSR